MIKRKKILKMKRKKEKQKKSPKKNLNRLIKLVWLLKSIKLYKVINKHIREIRKGFNVGVSTSNDGDVTNIWKHQYRHWNFVSKY